MPHLKKERGENREREQKRKKGEEGYKERKEEGRKHGDLEWLQGVSG